jgi:hypothetical protein
MKIVKELTGSGRLPGEFAQMNNFSNVYEKVSPTNAMLIEFINCYNGHYKDANCEWIIEEVDA